jgi:hypothetical protein
MWNRSGDDLKNRKKILAFAILIVSVLCIAAGIWQNEVATVLNKAVNICLECIGIG